jgi:hypothetical protein
MPKDKDKHPEPDPIPAHVHIWDILDVQATVQSYHPRVNMNPVTFVLIKCRECNLPQTIELTGTWTLDQVRHQAAVAEAKASGNENE